jgi:hypothetical protein
MQCCVAARPSLFTTVYHLLTNCIHCSAAVVAPQHYGMNKSVAVLRGSKAKSVDDWMKEAKAADGSALYGAGSNRGEDWWKGLGNVLLGEGYLASQSKTVGAC